MKEDNARPRSIIAIDPGAMGAVACYSTSFEPPAAPSWTVYRLKETVQDRAEQLHQYADAADLLEAPRVAILEDIGGFAGVGHPGSRMFNFGRGYGQLEGILATLQFQIIRVRPQVWQAALSLKTRKGESKPEHKRRMRAKAQDLFPALRPTMATCDALLLLYFFVTS